MEFLSSVSSLKQHGEGVEEVATTNSPIDVAIKSAKSTVDLMLQRFQWRDTESDVGMRKVEPFLSYNLQSTTMTRL